MCKIYSSTLSFSLRMQYIIGIGCVTKLSRCTWLDTALFISHQEDGHENMWKLVTWSCIAWHTRFTGMARSTSGMNNILYNLFRKKVCWVFIFIRVTYTIFKSSNTTKFSFPIWHGDLILVERLKCRIENAKSDKYFHLHGLSDANSNQILR